MKIEIGTVFIYHHKHYPITYTVEDIHTTYNAKGDIVKKTYICSFTYSKGREGTTELSPEQIKQYTSS